ncbi:DsrE family protein [Guyparkeria hydrothermalis]|uniref:DsrE family protein n=1 Tax=Guyparkeria hydrothermalis TaxID=923 RepID=UPI00201FC18B|nr:DsrE family protein [Guyparkeria hydrothermalis]MCL7751631.1 DsrE family protein [Guyparkeria hydrothermalis]
MIKRALLFACLMPAIAMASDNRPWGTAELNEKDYQPDKVVYDVAAKDAEALNSIIGRVSHLNNEYAGDVFDAHIVVVLHGDEIPLFTHEKYEENKELMERAQSLTVAGNIEYRMCAAAAALHDVAPEDVHGFVKVVPMADAEIIELQHQGYAYMK